MQSLPHIEPKPAVAIVGCGTVGTALARLLKDAGYRIWGVATSNAETARKACMVTGSEVFSDHPWEVTQGAQVVFITTPDDLIKETCAGISERGGFKGDAVVIHCSGALPADILSSARGCGAMVASLHPLQSFASAEQAVSLVPGSFCTMEGDQEALPVVRQIIEDIGGIVLQITPGKKTLYHAAAVAASNYLVTLIHLALGLNEAAGLPRDTSVKALFPLIKGTLSNICERGTVQALTGPIARGDVATVSAHIEAMEREAPGLLPIYRCLGLYTVSIARAKGGLDEAAARELDVLLGLVEDPGV